MNLLQTIGWCLYFIIAFAVVCVGVFGISATSSDRLALAKASVYCEPQYNEIFTHRRNILEKQIYTEATKSLYRITILVALFWPLGVPIYLAWKKGSFIDQALQKREELQHDTHRAG